MEAEFIAAEVMKVVEKQVGTLMTEGKRIFSQKLLSLILQEERAAPVEARYILEKVKDVLYNNL